MPDHIGHAARRQQHGQHPARRRIGAGLLQSSRPAHIRNGRQEHHDGYSPGTRRPARRPGRPPVHPSTPLPGSPAPPAIHRPTPGARRDHPAATADTSFNPAGGGWWSINTGILPGVDVTTAQTTADPGGIPTVSVLGDNLTDVNYNLFAAKAISFPITRLIGGLAAAQAGSFSVVAGGLNSNQASADSALSTGQGGVSAVARLDPDVLAEPGIGPGI